jgi:hypothetical protein
MGVAIMADYNYMKMTAEEIENLFLRLKCIPIVLRGEGVACLGNQIQADGCRKKQESFVDIDHCLYIFFLSILVNVGKAEEPKYPIMSINALGIAGNYPNTMNTIGCKLSLNEIS